MSIALVVLISVAVLVFTAIKTDRLPAVLLSLAFLLRLLVFIADYYHLAPIPFSGSDTEDFHVATLAYVAGDGPIKTNYTYVLAFFYRIFGAGGRMMAQFFNVLLSYGTVVLLYATLRWLKVNRKLILAAVAVLSFMPAIVCLSSVLLREAWVQFFLMLSACVFIHWYKRGGVGAVALCLAATYASMIMHAGSVGALPIYVLGFLFLRTWKTEGVKPYLFTVVVIAFFLALLPIFPELLLAKFASALSNLLLILTHGHGGVFDLGSAAENGAFDIKPVESGSAYLLWMRYLSFPVKMLLSPLKMIYLLISPMPWDWRNLTDAMVFFADSLVYLILAVMMFRRPLLTKTSQAKRFLIYVIFSLTFVFAVGTFSVGTAIRHRAKYVAVMMLAAAASKTPIEKQVLIPEKKKEE